MRTFLMIDEVGKVLPQYERDYSHLGDLQAVWLKDQQKLQDFKACWDNHGWLGRRKLTIRELLQKDIEHTKMMRDGFSSDHPLLTQRVISDRVQEAIEPSAVLAGGVYDLVQQDPSEILIDVAIGGVHASDIAEGQEYPEVGIELAGKTAHNLGKVGIAVRMSDEMIRANAFNLMNHLLDMAGKALIRLKEVKISDNMTSDATVLIDNSGTNIFRSSTGRNSSMMHLIRPENKGCIKIHPTC